MIATGAECIDLSTHAVVNMHVTGCFSDSQEDDGWSALNFLPCACSGSYQSGWLQRADKHGHIVLHKVVTHILLLVGIFDDATTDVKMKVSQRTELQSFLFN